MGQNMMNYINCLDFEYYSVKCIHVLHTIEGNARLKGYDK